MSANGRAAAITSVDRLRAAGAGEIVGVLALGKQREFEAFARPDQRQRGLERPKGRFAPGLVAVEAEDRLLGHRPQQAALVRRQRRAERRDGLRKARLGHRDDVDIALDRDHPALVAGRLAGAMVVKEQRALVEELGLRRIQVFRLGARVERPAAERDDPAAAIVNREHHAVLETVVGHGDALAMDEQTGLDHLLRFDALGRERVAQREFLRRPNSRGQRRAEWRGRGRGRRDSRAPSRRSAR